MDYKNIMDKDFDYPNFYNEVMKLIGNEILLPEDLEKKLKDKRNFGLEKYGEYSFQANFRNSMTSPSEEHLEEELIDAINYIMHSMFKSRASFYGNEIFEQEINIGKKLVRLYLEVLEINEVKQNNNL